MYFILKHGTDKSNLFSEVYFNRAVAYRSFNHMTRYYEHLFKTGKLEHSYTCLLYTVLEPEDHKEEVITNEKKRKKAKCRKI